MEVTDAMTRLRTVVVGDVHMTAAGWDSLLTLLQSVYVVLQHTHVDEGTVRRIQIFPHVNVTQDYVGSLWVGIGGYISILSSLRHDMYP